MRNLEVPLNELEVVFKELLKQMGLDSAVQVIESEVALSGRYNLAHQIAVLFKFGNDADLRASNKPFMNQFLDLKEKVYNSPIVKSAIADLEHKLKMANASSDELIERIKELEKYKTHYELELKLRHGENVSKNS